jgi:hypothetical protein
LREIRFKKFIDELKIRMDPESFNGRGVYVQGVQEKYVTCLEDYSKIITLASKQRHVGETNMNERSSRSHAVMTITVDQYQLKPGNNESSPNLFDSQTDVLAGKSPAAGGMRASHKRSKIHLIDLAGTLFPTFKKTKPLIINFYLMSLGSERAESTGATGQRLKEGSAINQSLSALGNVISGLTQGTSRKHIPYRDSKLTYLLSDSIGGNSLTLMITCCSPLVSNVSY